MHHNVLSTLKSSLQWPEPSTIDTLCEKAQLIMGKILLANTLNTERFLELALCDVPEARLLTEGHRICIHFNSGWKEAKPDLVNLTQFLPLGPSLLIETENAPDPETWQEGDRKAREFFSSLNAYRLWT